MIRQPQQRTDPDITAAQLIEHVKNVYRLDARSVAPFVGDVGWANYRVDCDQERYFLEIRSERPPPLARQLVDQGIVQVLAPLSPFGRRSTRISNKSILLFPFIEGQNAFATPLSETQWTELGAVLRAVHDAILPLSVKKVMHDETYSATWRNKVRRYLPPRSDGPGDAIARKLVALLRRKQGQIEALAEHATQLAASLCRKSPSIVPCHGDLHAGNLLIDRNGSLTIVDWDEPILAPRERDLMFIGAGVGGAWNLPNESSAFYRGYGPVSMDGEALAYYRCERIIEDVAVYCERLLLKGGDQGAERERSLRRLAEAFEPGNVVEIAEATFAAL